MLELRYDPKKGKTGIWCEDPESLEKLEKNFFGEVDGKDKKKRWLEIEEALFLINFQNASCVGPDGKQISFNDLAAAFVDKEPRLIVRYNAYRDWRDRGLVAKRMTGIKKGQGKKGWKRYPAKDLKLSKLGGKVSAVWYTDSLFSIIEDEDKGRTREYFVGKEIHFAHCLSSQLYIEV